MSAPATSKERRRAVTRIPLLAHVPERLLRFARVTAYVTVVAIAIAVLWGYRVRAQLTERMIDTGSAMLNYDGADRQDTQRTLLFNGQQIHLSSGMTQHPLAQVLDYYQEHCLSHDGGLTADIDRLIAEHPEIAVNTSVVDPIIRSERGDRGIVACLYSTETTGVTGFMERYERYQQSGDVADIGDMRYVYAEQGDHGTHFVAFWTEGSFVLRDMLPAEGDAPGHDPRDVGRPAHVRRFVSVREHGAPQMMTVYVAEPDGPNEEALETFYRDDLARRGWQFFAHRERDGEGVGAGLSSMVGGVLAAEKDERMVTLLFSTNDDRLGVVTILEAR